MTIKKQESIRDLYSELESLTDRIRACLHRNHQDAEPELSFEQKIIQASLHMDNGCPFFDILDEQEVMQAIQKLADIFITTGVKMPEDF